MSQEAAGEPVLRVESVKRRKKDLFLEGCTLSADAERHDFFGHLGPDFFVLNVPFSPEGRRIADLVTSGLGPASRGPETKCGGGCSGDGSGSGLVTVFSWDFMAPEAAAMRRKLSLVFGDKLTEPN